MFDLAGTCLNNIDQGYSSVQVAWLGVMMILTTATSVTTFGGAYVLIELILLGSQVSSVIWSVTFVGVIATSLSLFEIPQTALRDQQCIVFVYSVGIPSGSAICGDVPETFLPPAVYCCWQMSIHSHFLINGRSDFLTPLNCNG